MPNIKKDKKVKTKYHLRSHPHYLNLFLMFLGAALSLLFAVSGLGEKFSDIFVNLGGLGYVGAIIAGFFTVSTFTVGIGLVIMYNLAQHLNFFEIAFLAALGSVLGDLVVFKFVKSKIAGELDDFLTGYFHLAYFKKVLRTKYFRWTFPVIGALIIISPLPDEIGVSLIGISSMSSRRFIVLSYVLNVLGILFLLSVAYEAGLIIKAIT